MWLLALFGFASLGLSFLGASRLRLTIPMAATGCCLLGAAYALLSSPILSDSLSGSAQRGFQPIAVRAIITTSASWKPNPSFRVQDPTSQPWITQFCLRCLEVQDRDQWKPMVALCRFSVPGRIDDLLPGDIVEIYGSFARIQPPTNPGAFDYATRFQEDGMLVNLTAEDRRQIVRVGRSPSYVIRRLRAQLVRAADNHFRSYLTPTHASLAAALTVGAREQVEWSDQQSLMLTGTLHLLAISGLHVEILAGSLGLLLVTLGLRPRTVFVAIALTVCTYAFLAGAKPPVVRAAIVASAYAYARWRGFTPNLANILSLAALGLMIARVSNLWNVGVQLSFLAVITIAIFVLGNKQQAKHSTLARTLDENLTGIAWWMRVLWTRVGEMLRLSFWVWLITSPLIWQYFHIVSPISVPLNVGISIPLVASLLASLGLAIGGSIPVFGQLCASVASFSLDTITRLIDMGEAAPWGHYWLPSPPVWWSVAFYCTTVFWLFRFGARRRVLLGCLLTMWLAGGILWCEFGFSRASHSGRQAASIVPIESVDPELRCTFLDVGHGTSVIVELPDGRVWLYDAGRLGADERSFETMANALWHLGASKIDTVFLSHADADHYNGLSGLLKRFTIGKIASTSHFWQSTEVDVENLRQQILKSGTPTDVLASNLQGQTSGTHWSILHPSANLQASTDNESSLCLCLEYAGKRILLPGDLEGSGLINLTRLPPRPCHVLMAPHHGSVTFNPQQILNWCQPDIVVISGNHRALQPRVLQYYSLPQAETAITFRDGAIQIRIGPTGNLSTWHWVKDDWQLISSQRSRPSASR